MLKVFITVKSRLNSINHVLSIDNKITVHKPSNNQFDESIEKHMQHTDPVMADDTSNSAIWLYPLLTG